LGELGILYMAKKLTLYKYGNIEDCIID